MIHISCCSCSNKQRFWVGCVYNFEGLMRIGLSLNRKGLVPRYFAAKMDGIYYQVISALSDKDSIHGREKWYVFQDDSLESCYK